MECCFVEYIYSAIYQQFINEQYHAGIRLRGMECAWLFLLGLYAVMLGFFVLLQKTTWLLHCRCSVQLFVLRIKFLFIKMWEYKGGICQPLYPTAYFLLQHLL